MVADAGFPRPVGVDLDVGPAAGRGDERGDGAVPRVARQVGDRFAVMQQRDDRHAGRYPRQGPVVRPAAAAETHPVGGDREGRDEDGVSARDRVRPESDVAGPGRPSRGRGRAA